MGAKLSSRQQAQLAFLQTMPPKLDRIFRTIEAMGALQADDAQVRGLARLLDEIKMSAQGLGISGVADSAGQMGVVARRNGGLQMKVRSLREMLVGLRINYDGAVKGASTPEGGAEAPEA